MRLCLRTDLYVGVPVYFWPWVFWQLLQLDVWVEQTGRSVLGAVCKRTGEVFITFTADDPEEARPWCESDLQALLPNSPLWRSPQPGSWTREARPEPASTPVLRQQLSRRHKSDPPEPHPAASGHLTPRVPDAISDCPGLDPGPRPTSPEAPKEIPGRAALARDERNLFEPTAQPNRWRGQRCWLQA